MRTLLVAVVALGVAAAGAAAKGTHGTLGFPLGVAAGEVTPTTAKVWARAAMAGAVQIELWTGSNPGTRANPFRVYAARATTADDLTAQKVVTGLRPGTSYRYRFWQGTVRSPVGTFRTAPLPTADRPIRFAITGDADATPNAAGRPGFNRFETYGAMARARNDFNINLGDTIYSDSELTGAKPALDVVGKRKKYRLGLALPALRQLRASAGLYSHWDDHEFINDYTGAEHGADVYREGVRAFTEYSPVTYTARNGLYRTFRWGRNLELFFLDERSFRSGKVTAACNGDLAPTAPVAVRQAFTALVPGLAQPVTPACLAAIADPSRTMLGSRQYAAFVKAIRASTATFKVIVNEVPLMQLYALPYDRWEGYQAERERLLADLGSVKNAVVLTTDTHAHLIGEIRTRTFAPEGPVGTGIWEVVTGPVATNTYAKEIDSTLGATGSGAFVTSLFFKPPPPRGLGLACAQTDVYGYAQVAVTAKRLTVTPRTASGGVIREIGGAPCAPLVLTAR